MSGELLAAKQNVDNLKRAHADLLADCAEVRILQQFFAWLTSSFDSDLNLESLNCSFSLRYLASSFSCLCLPFPADSLPCLPYTHTRVLSQARSSLLSELLDDLSGSNSTGNSEAAAHLESVSGNRDTLLKMAAEPSSSARSQSNNGTNSSGGGTEVESAVALKARRALDTGNANGDHGGGKKRALDPNNYQFVKIAELVRACLFRAQILLCDSCVLTGSRLLVYCCENPSINEFLSFFFF